MSEKKVIACIIVRMKSTRLRKKALVALGDATMTEQLIRRLRTSKSINQIVICTSNNKEDEILLQKAKEWGVQSYAGHEEDVLSRLIEVSDIYDADMILRITGDNPFTDAENIDRLVEHHTKTSADYTRTNRLPLGVTAEVMDRKMLKKLYDVIPDPNQSSYLSFYSFNPDLFHCEVLEPYQYQDRPYYSLTIDYPEDLELARKLYQKLGAGGSVPSLQSVIDTLDADAEFVQVDKNMQIKLPENKTMRYEELIDMLDDLGRKSKKNNSINN